ncbi:hypothetical protein EV11_0577 [Prochlorococcus sp. SS52]|nr:hypothetical protein EV04_1247 [Prochlorococcus marinus str. LG]KGG21510.1 hypothetical protein EV08_0597 [Prochlorococcus marinus str. SS2]KGG23145.1 hypothetical protein EV09_1891 [Prochlorococcus marinus str. SS35]KGG33856.1 hypothetical protein EV10_0293 [Prochlorococcus marinus str. SS51]KGG36795.1 hypothetical protein EV11_0577 [Prochlorococcus sp. SS52]
MFLLPAGISTTKLTKPKDGDGERGVRSILTMAGGTIKN